MTAPKQPGFYVDLDMMAQRVGARSEDLLLVWSSEGFPTGAAGYYRTFSTMGKSLALPVIGQAVWEKLPTMTAQQQLPYVEKVIYVPAHQILGRSFRNAFETYLANAAPACLRKDGAYNLLGAMYAGGNYPDNWTMDNTPVGVQHALADHVSLSSLRAAYPYAIKLVEAGLLKGYVSLGDLAAFASRVLQGSGIFSQAIEYLNNVRDNVAAGLDPSIAPVPSDRLNYVQASYQTAYTPDLTGAFSPAAPISTPVASNPAAARAIMPSTAPAAGPAGPPYKQLSAGAIATGFLATAVGAWYLVKKD